MKEYDKNREFNYDYNGAWILRNGLFYGCEYAMHDVIAQYHFGYSEVSEFEKTGVVRLTNEQPFFQCLKPLSKTQIETIINYYEITKAVYALKLFYKAIEISC